MGARETNLSNARAFLVNHTRQQNDVRLFTDDKDKLVAQIENNRGDKSSALEAIGELAVEKILSEKGKEVLPELPVDLKKQSDAGDLERKLDLSGLGAVDVRCTAETAERKATDRRSLAPPPDKDAGITPAPADVPTPPQETQPHPSTGITTNGNAAR